MSKIVVFTEEGFKGRTAEFKNNVNNLEEKGFGDVISSLKVIGAPWVFFPSGSSPDDLDNPEIQLFEHINYQGRSVTLRQETSLHDIDFSDIASSHKVKGGVWVLYEHINRQGAQLVSFPGDEVPSYLSLSFNDVASHLHPLLPKP
ncbi:hypothetical protein QQF64_036011 [Cirrhinus molitorella]|uniref:Beta/gamma crystallin 'Greek key' domain-containing protein n=1 Tax=Cirrhinus molitorella TaxID=172907 RepID=A0ABR3NHD4_9TELE